METQYDFMRKDCALESKFKKIYSSGLMDSYTHLSQLALDHALRGGNFKLSNKILVLYFKTLKPSYYKIVKSKI